MSHSDSQPPTQFADLERFYHCLDRYVRMVFQLQAASVLRDESPWTAVQPLFYAVADSGDSLCTLIRQAKVRDAHVIARVIFETAVNACFLLASDQEVADRAWRHAKQKAIRDLDRTIRVGTQSMKIQWSGATSLLADPASQALLQEFTTAKGREVRDWTPEDVVKRIEKIGESFGDDAQMGFVFGLALFRHASDIAHGTLFGVLYAFGINDPSRPFPTSMGEVRLRCADNCVLVLTYLTIALESLIRIAAPLLDLNDLPKEARSLLKSATGPIAERCS